MGLPAPPRGWVIGPCRATYPHTRCAVLTARVCCWKCKVPRAAGSMARESPLPNCGLDHIAAPGSWLIPANHQPISATGIIRLTSLFSQSDRHEEDQTGRHRKTKKKASK